MQTEYFVARGNVLVRGASLLPIMGGVYMFSIYTTYLCWFWSMPKFLKVWNNIITFDEKHVPNVVLKTRCETIYKLIQTCLLWIEAFLNAAAFKSTLDFINLQGGASQNMEKSSWLFRSTGVQAGGWIVMAHMCIIQFPVGLSIQFILELSYAMRRRIDQIKLTLKKPANDQELECCCTQIIELMDLFDKLGSASSLIIVMFLTTTSLLITVYIFLLIVNLETWESNQTVRQFSWYFVVFSLFAIFKIVLLTNSGEDLMMKVRKQQNTDTKV